MRLLNDLRDASRSYDRYKTDTVVAPNRLSVSGGALIVPAATLRDAAYFPLDITPQALTQICAKLGPTVFGKGSEKAIPRTYVEALPTDLRDAVLSRHLRDTRNGTWMVRANDRSCRAVMDGNYPGGSSSGEYENTIYLSALTELITDAGGAVSVRPRLDADNVNIKIVWPVPGGGEAGRFGVGFHFGNSEAGQYKLRLLPLVQVTSCTNSVIGNSEVGGLERIHRGSFAALRTLFKAAIGDILGVSADMVARMMEAEEERIPDFGNVIIGLAARHGWTEDVSHAVAIGSGGQETRAGLVNGITFAAHSTQKDAEEEVAMERLGGAILVAPGSLFYEAARRGARVEMEVR